jgi:soluble lytic murein transglycosylase-like protein
MRGFDFRHGRKAAALVPFVLFAVIGSQASAQESAGFASAWGTQIQVSQKSVQAQPQMRIGERVRLRRHARGRDRRYVASVAPQEVASPRAAVVQAARAPQSGSQSGIHAMVTAAALRNGISPQLLHGVIRQESNYRCNAFNRRGQVHGLGQLKTATARSVGVTGSLYDCSNGVEAAARYLKIAIARGGSGCAGVSLYERGVYARPSCTAYGRSVMRFAQASRAS